MKTVLAAVDFSANTSQVAQAAVKLARLLHGRAVLLHVVPPPATIRDMLPAIDTVEQRARSLRQAAEQDLTELQRTIRRQYASIDTLVCSGAAAETILEQAGRVHAEYIVLGSHGHTAAHDLVMGSVASGVMKHAACPVLVLPPHLPSNQPATATQAELHQAWS